ncbi:MAG: phosphopantetheine adenylyltransferase [Pseudomonadota bacterium]
MNGIVAALFILVGLIHLLPAVGVVSDVRLHALYGVGELSADLSLLLRHRAVLFAILGALLIAAAFLPGLRLIVTATGLLSMLSFVALAHSIGTTNPALLKVLRVDIAASVALLVAAAVHLRLAATP